MFGAGRAAEVPGELAALGVRRPLLIATLSAKRTADELAAALEEVAGGKAGPSGGMAGRIHEVVQHVPAAEAHAALALARESGADGLVTVGGGSAIGLGKAVAVRTGLPLVAVPTTYSGSEATPVFGVTGTHKTTGRDPRALPRTVVYDPVLTVPLPAAVTATSGLNAVAHCVEALWSTAATPYSDLPAAEGLRLLAEALPAAVTRPGDLAARGGALLGAHLAGTALTLAGTGLHHVLCHVIGGTYRLGHGDLHAVLLPYVAGYVLPAAPEAARRVAGTLGTTDAVTGLRALAESLGAPTGLADLGLPPGALDDVVDRTVAAGPTRGPRGVEPGPLRRLLDDAYAGVPPGRY